MFHIKTHLTTKLDASKIRDEYKCKVDTDYLLPSVRFALTVHAFTKTCLNTLDQTVDQYLKTWHGLPKGAANAVLHW